MIPAFSTRFSPGRVRIARFFSCIAVGESVVFAHEMVVDGGDCRAVHRFRVKNALHRHL